MSAPDPVPALVAERMKILAIAERDGHSEKKLRKLGDQYAALDKRIADMVAPSIAGILAQVELLISLTEDVGAIWADNRDRRLMEAIKAGLRNLLPADAGDAA
jgi:hypothetical protein